MFADIPQYLSANRDFPLDYRLLYLAHLFWIIAYGAIIVRSQKDRLTGIPVVVVPFNLVWEFNSFTDCALVTGAYALFDWPINSVCNALGSAGETIRLYDFYMEAGYLIVGFWFALDVIIFLQCIWYGNFGVRRLGRLHWPVKLAVASVLVILAFALESMAMVMFQDRGSVTTAWIVNLVMSSLFVRLALTRKDKRGLSLVAAYAKLLGSGLVAIYMVWAMPRFVDETWVLVPIFVIVLLLDILYAALLSKHRLRNR